MMGAGADGAGLARAVSGRLVVCPTPIGNLEDVTLRVLAALREADVVACEDTRRTRVLLDRYGVKARLVSVPRAQREGAAGGARGADARRRRWWRSCRTPGMPLVSDPGYCSCAPAWRPGCRSRCCPGRRRRSRRWSRRAAGGRVALPGFLPRKKGELREVLAGARERGPPRRWRSSPPAAAGDAGAARRARSGRRGGRCRELTKAHEEIVRGTAAELAARYATARRRARSSWSIAPPSAAPAGSSPDPPPSTPSASSSMPALIPGRQRRSSPP